MKQYACLRSAGKGINIDGHCLLTPLTGLAWKGGGCDDPVIVRQIRHVGLAGDQQGKAGHLPGKVYFPFKFPAGQDF